MSGDAVRLVFRVTPDQRLIFTENAVQQMLAHVQWSFWKREAGGVLLGRHLLDSNDVVVDEVTGPQSSDRRTRISFFRSKKHEELAKVRWSEEENTLAYLGLWHTHPEDSPTPSGVDRKDWQQAVEKDTFDGPQLFFPIVGRREIRVWTKSRRGQILELTKL
jgi:integrative and conjugative element protein (TIGR02256 family)